MTPNNGEAGKEALRPCLSASPQTNLRVMDNEHGRLIGSARRWFVAVVFLTVFVISCGSSDSAPVAETIVTEQSQTLECVIPRSLVPAAEVEVIGELDAEERETVNWALGRFSMIDLELTTPIRVQFDSSRELCNGDPGRCLLYTYAPAELFVCEQEGQTAARIDDRRLTVLHELAHVWHFAKGDGVEWPDFSGVVGGKPGGPGVIWADDTVERVADVMSWGLMDHELRRARGVIPCEDMYAYFVALTGHKPLPPVNAACVVDVVEPGGP